MAPLPTTNTARYVVHYTSGGEVHTQEWRLDPPPSPAAMATFLDAVWTALAPVLYFATITDLVFYANGSPIGNSVAAPAFVGLGYGAAGVPNNINGALQLNAIGRSSGGRRTRVGWFSPSGTDPSWRFNAGENASIDAAIALIKANSAIVAIDGIGVVWKSYMNVGFNAYWQRARRS